MTGPVVLPLTDPPATAPIAEHGEFADGEEFVCHVLADVEVDGGPLGLLAVDTETPPAEEMPPYFIRVTAQAGRGGIGGSGITATFAFSVETYAPDRRSSRQMTKQVANLLLRLDRGGASHGVLVDACYNTAAEVDESRDDDETRVESSWAIEWRRHWGPTVYAAA